MYTRNLAVVNSFSRITLDENVWLLRSGGALIFGL